MKKFVFRLQSVLRIREFELDRARAERSKLEIERNLRAARVSEAGDKLEIGRRILADEAREGASGERLAMRADGVTVGRIALQRAQYVLKELEPALREARERVQAARVRVESLERLRERRAESHRRESLAAEQAELEDLSIARIARRRILENRLQQENRR